jgi:Tfp pilus assembly protein FimT
MLAIVAMLVAVLMPAIPGSTSRPRLEAYALEVAAVLKIDRTAAIQRHRLVATDIRGRGAALQATRDRGRRGTERPTHDQDPMTSRWVWNDV